MTETNHAVPAFRVEIGSRASRIAGALVVLLLIAGCSMPFWAEPARLRGLADEIFMDDKIKEYIIDLVVATRDPQAFKLDLAPFIQYGASPRATLYLTLAAKAHAFVSGRGYVTPQDVKSIGMDVLRHRVTITYEAEAEDKTSETIVQKIFDELPVP